MHIMRSISTKTSSVRERDIKITYNLIFRNALYSLECIKESGREENPNDYCLAENITDDETEAEIFLNQVAKGKVFPVHIKDLVEDYFN